MKKILSVFVGVFVVAVSTMPALAGYGDRTEQELYGSKVPIAKYWVGQCLQSDKEIIQQLSDGTFALSGDSLYTCNKRGLANNWTGNPALNPWGTNSGTGINFPYLPTSTTTYPWGTNYPGGFNNYSDWLKYCVAFGTLILSQECMSYPRTWSNGVPTYDNPLSAYGINGYTGRGYGSTIYNGYNGFGGGYGGYVGSPSVWSDFNSKDLLKTLLIGWGANWLLDKIV